MSSVSGVMNKSESCDKYHFVSGCNIIDHTCKCEEVSICNTENGTPQTTPFPTTHAPLDGSPDGGGIGGDSRGIDNDRTPDNRGIRDGASDTRVEEAFGEPPDKSPFSFVNRLECEMNLKVLLTHEILDDNTGKNLD